MVAGAQRTRVRGIRNEGNEGRELVKCKITQGFVGFRKILDFILIAKARHWRVCS